MKTRSIGISGIALIAGIGCASNDGHDAAGGARESLGQSAAALSTGSIPYPSKVVNGSYVPNWNGTIVDLMGADAWAQCAAHTTLTSADDGYAQPDAYLSALTTRMDTSLCTPSTYDPSTTGFTINPSGSSVVHQWAKQRQTRSCNVQVGGSAGTWGAVQFSSNQKVFHTLPSAATLGVTGSAAAAAVTTAQRELDAAETALCMAQRLREYQASPDALLLSGDDQRELLGVIRERAQVAMLQYSVIAQAMANNDGRADSVSDTSQVIPPFRRWAAQNPYGNNSNPIQFEIGSDWLSAVQLHSQAAEELGTLLVRSASARLADGRSPGTDAEREWGPASWRQRLLALLYGGDPLADPWSGKAPWSHYTNIFFTDLLANWKGLPYVTTDVTAPEVHELLRLARTNDALYLKTASYVDERSGTEYFSGVDQPTSATRLYRAIEAAFRNKDCLAADPTSTTCTLNAGSTSIPATTSFDQYLLWQRFRITPDHALTLVKLLSEATPRVSRSGTAPQTYEYLKGGMRVTGTTQLVEKTLVDDPTGYWYHFDKQATFAPLDATTLVTPFTSPRTFGTFYVPSSTDIYSIREGNGFGARDGLNQAMRGIGAVPALGVVRDAIRIGASTGAASQLFTTVSQGILGVVRGAIGPREFTIRPQLQPVNVYDTCLGWNTYSATSNTWCWERLQPVAADGKTASWEVGFLTDPADTLFSDEAHTQIVAVKSTGVTATATLDATLAMPGNGTAASILTAVATLSSGAKSNVAGSNLVYRAFTMQLPSDFYSFAVRTQKSDGTYSYMLLADNVELTAYPMQYSVNGSLTTKAWASPPSDARYIATDGVLGSMAKNAWSPKKNNWARPGLDGFGFPVDWVPPSDPSLLLGSSGEDVVSIYLKNAATAADQATSAVKDAVDELLKEEADDATLAAAQQRATGIQQIDQKSVCGESNPTCDTSTVALDLGATGIVPAVPCNAGATDSQSVLMCKMNRLLSPLRGTVVVATAVANHRSDATAPAFDDYKGGSLQSVLLEQWQALRNIGVAATNLVNVANAAAATADASGSAANAAQSKADDACSEQTQNAAMDACYSTSVGVSAGFCGASASVSVSFNSGPLLAAQQKCRDLSADVEPAQKQAVAARMEAFARIGEAATKVADASTALQAAVIKGDQANEQGQLATARANLEASLASINLTTKFGTAIRYHSYDMWRAQALLESARRFAVTARRAIEARYVIDMSTMQAPEAFVAAPATWADEIYEYDLDPPSAVGLSTTAGLPQGGIYANRLSDYVGNLQRLVDGYAVTRPTAVAKTDSELITLPGANALVPQTPGGPMVLAGSSAAWQFLCPGQTNWLPHPAASEVPATSTLDGMCGVSSTGAPLDPIAARISFSLDPWARLDGDVAHVPLVAQHNARWTKLAINVVGTGVRDCTKASDPPQCYADSFIRYGLTQTGPAWVTDYSEQWRELGFPLGRIEEAKALAAEQWLDPVANGWGKPFVDAVARDEFLERPFGGMYELTLELAPEDRMANVERIQVLAQSSYWVKQE